MKKKTLRSSGPKRHIPLRSCIVCQSKAAKRDLLRVVRTPEGTVELDPTGKKSGRGAYLCKNIACWEKPVKRGRLEHALRASIPEDKWDELRGLARPLTNVN